jgi:hypothetical protein
MLTIAMDVTVGTVAAELQQREAGWWLIGYRANVESALIDKSDQNRDARAPLDRRVLRGRNAPSSPVDTPGPHGPRRSFNDCALLSFSFPDASK